MDILGSLRDRYTPRNNPQIAHYVGEDPDRFRELMRAFIEGPYRITQRAIHPVELCVKKKSQLIHPHLPELIKILYRKESDPSLVRNILRTLQFVDIPSRYQGKLFEKCMQLMSAPESPIAIKVFSMTVAANISSNLPELKNELSILISQRLPYESAGFISRGNKILKLLPVR
jgi:hypothetical protein